MSDAKAVSTMLARTHSREQALADRLHCQLRFSEQLCELRPEACAAWKPLLEQAHRLVAARTVDGAHLPGLVGEIETLLAPFAPLAKSFTVHGIGHAHIDMNWMWGWPETVAVVVDTVGTVLRLLDEFPEFHFTQSQAEIYRILAEHAPPGYLDAIRRHIASGRWEVAASHWVEGDKNMASGESLCRQVLYAKRYLHQLLGVAPETLTIDWAPDTFGHAATMPTYLAQAGIRHTFLHRPGAHTAEAWPEAFRWYAPDGAMTLVLNGMRGGYNGIFCPRMLLDRLGTWWRTTGLSAAPYLYGVGDHGGGPTRRDLLQCREVSSWPIFPRITLGPAGGFFAELERVQDRLPAVRGELNFAFTGCYTSQSLLKRCNRLGEARLDDAERAAAARQHRAGHRLSRRAPRRRLAQRAVLAVPRHPARLVPA